MKLEQISISKEGDFEKIKNMTEGSHDFGVVFGGPKFFENRTFVETLKGSSFPWIGCSTAGEIIDDQVLDDSLVATVGKFDSPTDVKVARASIKQLSESFECGKELGSQLQDDELKIIVVLGIGVNINGSELIRGMRDSLKNPVPITGGLAGDNGKFEKTYTISNQGVGHEQVVALGFSGEKIRVGYASQGGWKPFGPTRKVTQAEGNILYKLDDQPALEIYRNYLGEKAGDLPAAGLLYPFAIVEGKDQETGLIRTILGIDNEKGSLTLAGDMPPNSMVRLMHTGNEGLVDGAKRAAKMAVKDFTTSGSGLALLVSCVGRKIVMGDDTDEELDAVKENIPDNSSIIGFYSYGEICPFEKSGAPLLHNQTMTITYIDG